MKIKAYKKNRRCIANGSVESMTLHLVDGIVMEIPGTHIKAVATCHDSDEYDAEFGVALASAKYTDSHESARSGIQGASCNGCKAGSRGRCSGQDC